MAHLIAISVYLTCFVTNAVKDVKFQQLDSVSIMAESKMFEDRLGKEKLEDPSLEVTFDDAEAEAINKFFYFKDKVDRAKNYVDK